jgi:hypothetical protein
VSGKILLEDIGIVQGNYLILVFGLLCVVCILLVFRIAGFLDLVHRSERRR